MSQKRKHKRGKQDREKRFLKKENFITSDYPDVIARETNFSRFWYFITGVMLVLLLIWPTQLAAWIGFIFFSIISAALFFASRGKPIPTVAIPIIVAIDNAFAESSVDAERFKSLQDRENRLGIISDTSYRSSDQSEYAKTQQDKQKEFEELESEPVIDDRDNDYPEGVWKV